MQRLIAVGDIHGQHGMLVDLMAKVAPGVFDQLVFLGDYIDRGAQSPAVLNWLIDFQQRHPGTVFLRGNHEQMLLDAVNAAECKMSGKGNWLEDFWALQQKGLPAAIYSFLSCGGVETLTAYQAEVEDIDLLGILNRIPQAHLDFIRRTQFYYCCDRFMFVHAGVDPQNPTGEKDNNQAFLWERAPLWKADRNWDKVVVHGHTPVDRPSFTHLEINLDTGAGYDGCLTACDVLTGNVWQVAA